MSNCWKKSTGLHSINNKVGSFRILHNDNTDQTISEDLETKALYDKGPVCPN